jgi:lipid kinase YegS
MPRRLHLVVHAKVAADTRLMAAVEAVRGRGHEVVEQLTESPGSAARLAEAAALAGADAIVAAGGDGTLHEVLQGVAAAGLPAKCGVGVVPLGTANDFAAGAGIPIDDPVAALDLVAAAEPTPIDLGRVGDRYFLNVASGGFVSEVTTATPEAMKKLLGGVAYLLTGLVSWGSIEARPVRLRGPGLDWDGKLYVLAVGNGRQAGGGFRLCDGARLDDGLFDVVVIAEAPFDEALGILADLLAGSRPPSSDHVHHYRLPWLEVEAADGMTFNLDGEPHSGQFFRFDVLPRHLRFFLPSTAPLVGRLPDR